MGVRPSVVYQCFEAIVILFVALSIRYFTLAPGDPRRLDKARTLPWVEVVRGEFGEGMIACLIYRYSAHSYAGTCLEEDEG